MRVLVSLLVCALLAGGCSNTSDDLADAARAGRAGRDATLAALQEDMQEVAGAQDAADDAMGRTLTAVRGMDGIVAGLRDPARVDKARDSWSQVDDAMGSASIEGLRDRLFEIAYAVDDARQLLAAARQHAAGDWEAGYLDAQDELLQAVRRHAEKSDALAKALITYWPVYELLHGETGRFVEQRWFYRSSQEAADAYELAVSAHLNELAAAQGDIREAIEARDETGRQVSAAQAEVKRRFEERLDAASDPAASSG